MSTQEQGPFSTIYLQDTTRLGRPAITIIDVIRVVQDTTGTLTENVVVGVSRDPATGEKSFSEPASLTAFLEFVDGEQGAHKIKGLKGNPMRLSQAGEILAATSLVVLAGMNEYNNHVDIADQQPALSAADAQARSALNTINDTEATLACVDGLQAPIGEFVVIIGTTEAGGPTVDCLERIAAEADSIEVQPAYGYTVNDELFVASSLELLEPGAPFDIDGLKSDLNNTIDRAQASLEAAETDRQETADTIDNIESSRNLRRIGIMAGTIIVGAVALGDFISSRRNNRSENNTSVTAERSKPTKGPRTWPSRARDAFVGRLMILPPQNTDQPEADVSESDKDDHVSSGV